jgi:hypothetical protein
VSSSAYAVQDIEVCSDQIVAEPKCNADEQVFSQCAAGLTFSSAKTIRGSSPLNVGLDRRCRDLVKLPVYEIEKQLLLSSAAK